MRFTTTDVKISVGSQQLDGRLYTPAGDKKSYPAVVFFHGRGSQKSRYFDRAEALAKEGVITLIFSFRGCGESDGELDLQTPAMSYDDALAGYDSLASQHLVDSERIGVWGGSFGGYLASFVVASRAVKSLVLEAPAIYRSVWWNTPLEAVPDDVKQNYRGGADFASNLAISSIRGYKGSVLLIRHELDVVCPRHQAQFYLDNASSAVLREEKEIKGVGHRLVEEKHLVESTRITVDWYKKTLFD